MSKTKKARQQVQVIDIFLELEEIDKTNYIVIVKDYFGGKYALGKFSRIAEETWDFSQKGDVKFRLKSTDDISILKAILKMQLIKYFGKDSFK